MSLENDEENIINPLENWVKLVRYAQLTVEHAMHSQNI